VLKLSRTIINPPDGRGSEIKAIEAHYYNTEIRTSPDKTQTFRVGQVWSRGDNSEYQIKELILKLDRNKNTKLIAILKIIDGPQLLSVNLLTLIKFWTLLDFNTNYDIIHKDNRFEVIE